MQQKLYEKLINSLDQNLYEHLPEFPKIKKEFKAAIQTVGDENCHTLCFAFEQRVFTALFFSAQQGYQRNLFHFQDPSYDPLAGNYLREEDIYSLPG